VLADVRFVPKADILRWGKKTRIEQIGPQVVAREEQKLSVDWVW
jgi:hypothetical protein